jgi:4-aminobutyrate aminotransferase-like enzyme
VKEIREDGFFMAVELGDGELVSKMADLLLQNGIVTDLFLFNKTAFRISPPLPMTEEEINEASDIIIKCLNILLDGKE